MVGYWDLYVLLVAMKLYKGTTCATFKESFDMHAREVKKPAHVTTSTV